MLSESPDHLESLPFLNMLSHFIASGGACIEYVYLQAENARARLVVWPCGGGNARAYKLPRKHLTALGVDVLLFNPRGHGGSTGEFTFEESVRDLRGILAILTELPLYGLGHSMGVSGLCMLHRVLPLRHIWAVAPIFDSRKSLSYMYARGTISEFHSLMGFTDIATLPAVLQSSGWMYQPMGLYRELDFPQAGAIRTGSLAGLLKALFIPGHDMFPYLVGISDRLEVFVPAEDHWFPQDETLAFCQAAGITARRVLEAKNHFFSGGWNIVGDRLIEFFKDSANII